MEWIKALKPGDAVFIVQAYCGGGKYMKKSTVEKVTPTGLVKVDGIYYKPDDGNARGKDAWTSQYIADPKNPKVAMEYEEYLDHKRRMSVKSKLLHIDLTTDQAKAICGIMGWRYE